MKARILFILALALTTVIPLAPPALAHHSFAAEYDADKPVTLTGSVTKMAWIKLTVLSRTGPSRQVLRAHWFARDLPKNRWPTRR